MIYFLLLTALTVSIDSLFCGFTLSLIKPKKLPIAIIITTVVFAMCLITNYGAIFLKNYLTEKTASLGGVILIAIGIYNLLKKEDKALKSNSLIKQTLMSAFAVGLDGAFANLSLSIMGINAFYVPITIAFFHGIMVLIGVYITNLPLISKLKKYTFIPPLLLIGLGLYKLFGFLI